MSAWIVTEQRPLGHHAKLGWRRLEPVRANPAIRRCDELVPYMHSRMRAEVDLPGWIDVAPRVTGWQVHLHPLYLSVAAGVMPGSNRSASRQATMRPLKAIHQRFRIPGQSD